MGAVPRLIGWTTARARATAAVRLRADVFQHTMQLIPDRVAFESPQGRIVSGPVVNHEIRASTASTTTLLTVDVDGSRFRVPAAAVATP